MSPVSFLQNYYPNPQYHSSSTYEKEMRRFGFAHVLFRRRARILTQSPLNCKRIIKNVCSKQTSRV